MKIDLFILSKILVDFRIRCNKDFLLQLREHFKHENEKGLHTCNKGEIVFVYEPNKERADLKIGITENFKPSQDGEKQIAVANA